MNPSPWRRLPAGAARRKVALLTGKLLLALFLLLVLLGGAGCVSRTVTRSRHLSELTGKKGHNADDQGHVVETRLIWIWQREFWEH